MHLKVAALEVVLLRNFSFHLIFLKINPQFKPLASLNGDENKRINAGGVFGPFFKHIFTKLNIRYLKNFLIQ
jgi:hypothetical protein